MTTPVPYAPPALPIPADQPLPWLGGLSAAEFLRDYWQKQALFVKGAFAGFAQGELPVSVDGLMAHALSGILPARLVDGDKRHAVTHGPLKRLPRLTRPRWTVLVQQVNTEDQAADLFLDHFRFIPEGRLDDLMISLASEDGGIGAHVDSYDVFLIQGAGVRRWETARVFDPAYLPDRDLRMLARFEPDWQHDCEPGDLLYLPPGIAHKGTALTTGCMTYSVGFRVPAADSLADEALGRHLGQLEAQGRRELPWQDPWLTAETGEGRLPDALVQGLAEAAMTMLPSREDMARQVVISLSEPHPQVLGHEPVSIELAELLSRCQAPDACLRLAPGARIMAWRDFYALDGEPLTERLALSLTPEACRLLDALMGHRSLRPEQLRSLTQAPEAQALLHRLYEEGFVRLI